MAVFLNMPKLGLMMREGTLTRWNKTEGEAFSVGESLFEMEAGKMSGSAPAEAEGTLLKILLQEGERTKCSSPVAIFGQADEEIQPLVEEFAQMQEKNAQVALQAAKVAVIGAGPGGYVAAIRAAQLGGKVTLIERRELGGTCLNEGCIPTKALLHCAALFNDAKNGAAAGVICQPELNFPGVMQYKERISSQLISGVAALLRTNEISLLRGTASFVDEHTLAVVGEDETKTLRFDKIIIASGSLSVTVPIPGAELSCCITSAQALALKTLPTSMVIVGGGVIGMEMATTYANFGTKVTVVEMLPCLLPDADQELVEMARKKLEEKDIRFLTSTKVLGITKTDAGAVVAVETAGERIELATELVLICTGRKPNLEHLQLENAGIMLEAGRIITDAAMQTSSAAVYAIGDCTSKIMLAHVASAQGEVAAENALGGKKLFSAKTAPSCIYMEPELASVGLTEAQAKQAGAAVTVAHFALSANGKSLIENGGYGRVKLVVESTFGRILGIQILGPHATDLIAQGALAIQMGAKAQNLIDTIYAHPTVGEAIHEAALAVQGRAIHS